MIAFALSNFVAAAAPTYWSLVAARILLAFSAGLYVPGANALAGAMVAPERRGRAIAIVNAAIALTGLSTIGAVLSPRHALIPVIAAIILWGAAHWGFWPAQQARLIGFAGLKAASVVLSLNASFMYLGFSLGAALGSVTLADLSVGALGWVGGSSIFASLLPFLLIRRKEIPS